MLAIACTTPDTPWTPTGCMGSKAGRLACLLPISRLDSLPNEPLSFRLTTWICLLSYHAWDNL